MMRCVLRLLLLSLVGAAVLAACDDGGGGPDITISPADGASPTARPAGEPSPTAAAEPSPTEAEAPGAPVPDVDPSLQVLNIGEMAVSMGAGESYGFEPLDLSDGEAPPCAAFVFLFGWQVQDPYPPDGVAMAITSTRMGASETVGEGASGMATIGCGFIEVRNDSAFPIAVEIRYAVAQMTE